MHKLLPETKISDDTKLADIGYDDPPSKDIIRGKIDNYPGWHGRKLGFNALRDCSTIADVIKAVG